MKKVSEKLISIIMPVKDAGKFVAEAVESIQSQTYPKWELIAINDGSSDDTGRILRSLATADKRIKIITHTKAKGIGASLNEALRLAKGEYIARMDGDDVSLPNRLELQKAYLDRHPHVVAVGGQVEMIDGEGNIFAFKHFPTDSQQLREMIMWMVPIQHPVMMARAEIYKKCGYDEELATAEDVDLMMQLLHYGEFGNVNKVIFQYRKADTSNGYHNVKQTFFLTLLGRVRGITRYGYIPTFKGLALSLFQLLTVGILPSKWVVRLYESRRFMWLMKAHLSRWLWAVARG